MHSNARALPSPWLDPTNPILEKTTELQASQTIPFSINGNRDCVQQKIVVQPLVPPNLSEISHQSCVVDSGIGAISTSGYLQLPATHIWGQTSTADGRYLSLLAIPRSTTAMYLSGGSYAGSYAYFVRDASFYPLALPYGQVEYRLKPGLTTIQLKDRSGKAIPIDYGSISFSPDGSYMIADSPVVGAIRVNLATLEVLPFSPPVNYFSGVNPTFQTAITSDGSYAVMASKNFGIFKIFDLSTCGPVPDIITTAVSCQVRDLRWFAMKQIPNFNDNIISVRVLGEYSFTFYYSYRDSSGLHISRYLLTAPGQQPATFEYLALGDSFASGEGAFAYKAYTDMAGSNTCHLSVLSYPYLIAKSLHLNTSESVACSGALIKDIGTIYSPKVYNKDYSQSKNKVDPTFDTEIIKNFLPGHRMQDFMVEKIRPSVITISTVGNDIGFSSIIKRCLGDDTCYQTYDERYRLMQQINRQFDRLVKMYADLKQNDDPRAKIYVLGYPQIVDPEGNCPTNVHLNHDELTFANQLVDYLDSVIKSAAGKAGVGYIDTSQSFVGHRLCEVNGSNSAVNGLTAGNDSLVSGIGPFANESFHPTPLGHILFQDTILKATSNFTAAMPYPDTTLQAPDITNQQPLLKNALPSAGALYVQDYYVDDLAPDSARPGDTVDIKSGNLSLIPNTSYSVEVHSTPRSLGTLKTDASGVISGSVTLPADLADGYHTIHITGKNLAGESVDLYKTLFVGDKTRPCGGLYDTTIDQDEDGLPDACDGIIGEPPIHSKPNPATPPLQSGNTKVHLSESSPWATYQNPMLEAPVATASTSQSPNLSFSAPISGDRITSVTTASPATPEVKGVQTTVATAKPSQQALKAGTRASIQRLQLAGLGLSILTLLGSCYAIVRNDNTW